MRKNTITQRLNIIKGQLDGLSRMISDETNCQKVTAQFKAINSAFKSAMEEYLKENLGNCMRDMNLTKNRDAQFLIKEIIETK